MSPAPVYAVVAMQNQDIPEDRFLDWFVKYESECGEFREEIADQYERFITKRGMRSGDPREPFLRDFLFGDYEPL